MKKLNKLDIILLVDCCILLTFTATILVGWFKFQTEPSSLIMSFFTAFGLEVVLTAAIKISKIRNESKEDTHDDRSTEGDSVGSGDRS